ncbi:DUF1707 and FHA domain-containing protein [Streptomyces sp. DSM 42041]|uniref:DUF1707 and FHA domain-containing protein n=1 Tax=Streptomyces hazeniae TaxID=3075538 RepID=A0ABU2NYK3_9ACTN|nr:DUF1707 and FHA domain-containing protein [Streptomyces sp. DSM 42041]MDT0381278.1 DUF1707 and FHA domain-containing protein [Streptomyces sp. DSM 42041]
MTSLEFSAYPPRLSDGDRERALEVLRESAADGRVSQDTFLRRMEVILHAQRHDELDLVLGDLHHRRSGGTHWLYRMVGRASAFPVLLRRAWQRERLPELMLPGPGPYPLSIGRAPGSMLRLTHHTVSRAHAQLRHTGAGWSLRDLGSSNGTWVNGRRVTGSVAVRPGDHVQFGQAGFRLTAP